MQRREVLRGWWLLAVGDVIRLCVTHCDDVAVASRVMTEVFLCEATKWWQLGRRRSRLPLG